MTVDLNVLATARAAAPDEQYAIFVQALAPNGVLVTDGETDDALQRRLRGCDAADVATLLYIAMAMGHGAAIRGMAGEQLQELALDLLTKFLHAKPKLVIYGSH